MTDRLYPRGFAIHLGKACRNASLPSSEYTRKVLPGGVAFDVERSSEAYVSLAGQSWALLIGNPLYVSPDESFDPQELCNRVCSLTGDSSAIERMLYDTGGRYVLVVRDGPTDNLWLYHDAHGNRSVYWQNELTSISSHWDYLRRQYDGEPSINLISRLPTRWRFNATKRRDIHALLPNRKLNLRTGEVVRYFPSADNQYLGLETNFKFDLITSLWRRQISAILQREGEVAGSLTAGMDSRILLALAWPFRDELTFFTYASTEESKDSTPGTRAMESDLKTAIEIAEKFGLKHLILRRSESEAATVDASLAARNSTQKHLTWLLPLYSANFDYHRTYFYRGNMLETALGRSTYMVGPDWKQRTINQILSPRNRRHFSDDELVDVENEITRRLDQLDADIVFDGYDARDFAYWEIRIGRWLAEISNETDAAFDTFTPFNHRRIIDLFMSLDVQERSDGTVSNALIARLAPDLLSIPINGRPPYYSQIKMLQDSIDAKSVACGRTPTSLELTGVQMESTPHGVLFVPQKAPAGSSQFRARIQWTIESDNCEVGLVFEYNTKNRARKIATYKNSEIIDYGVNLVGRELRSVKLGSATRGDLVELEFDFELSSNVDAAINRPYVRIVSYAEV